MSDALASDASFRDPCGFIFKRNDVIYRQVNAGFEEDLNLLISSGLHSELCRANLVVDFEVVDLTLAASQSAAMILRPSPIRYITYPFEWSFSQLKDAALLTLELMVKALDKGMTLKDASGYNIQFIGPKPIHIDTLSFEKYEGGKPWVAYKQFCQHFLAPLALMSKVDIRLATLLQTNIDGIPLDLASNLLPRKTKFSPGLLTHIHLHAKAQSQSEKGVQTHKPLSVSKTAILALLDSLRSTITKLTWSPTGTEWSNYYSETNYSSESFSEKGAVVKSFLEMIPNTVQTCCDLGANNGEFSRLATAMNLETVALDIDPAAVEQCYRASKQSSVGSLLPVLQDLRNPTASFGWAGSERDSLAKRCSSDVILALALIHHLAIGNNLPLPKIADYFAELGTWAIVEFVPKEDSQVQRMLVNRPDIFANYNQESFESAFETLFTIVAKQLIGGTTRTVYLLRRIAE